MRDTNMNPIRSIFFSLSIAAVSPALAETVKFEDAAGLLGASCAKDIDTNCRGVNLDPTRLKDCLYRNEDVLSPQCKNDYGRAFDAIHKRVADTSAASQYSNAAVTKSIPETQQAIEAKLRN